MYTRFERFWHWSQALLILLMLGTGFDIHFNLDVFGYEQANQLHSIGAWLLIGLWIFAWFWHLTTGEWKQYIPSTPERIMAMAKFYAFEIFQGKSHPFHKDPDQKLNPLQRMAYLSLHVAIGPAIWISGLLYLFYGDLDAIPLLGSLSLTTIALVHTAAAFLMLAFLVAHLYLALTMDEKPLSGLHAMITGYEQQDES
jgi:thiosulfate reductase cytochrome b subunit